MDQTDELVLLQAALLEIEATGWNEGVLFGPDKEIDVKIRAFLKKCGIDPPPYP